MGKRTWIWVLNICKSQSWSLRRSLVSLLLIWTSLILSICMYVDLCVLVFVTGRTFTCVLLSVEPRGKLQVPSSSPPSKPSFDKVSLTGKEFTNEESQWAKDLPIVAFPALDYKNELHAWWFYLGPGVQAEVLMLVWQVFYWVSHVAPPSHVLLSTLSEKAFKHP